MLRFSFLRPVVEPAALLLSLSRCLAKAGTVLLQLQVWLCARHVYHERLVLVVILARMRLFYLKRRLWSNPNRSCAFW